MRVRSVAALAMILVGFFACEPARPPPPAAPPPVASTEGKTEPTVVAVTEPSVSASAPPSASSSPVVASVSAAPSSSAAPGIPCKSVDDCWVDGQSTAAKPIKRPKHLRGKKFKPCEDGEAAPVCMNGVCGTMGYFC